MADTEHMQRRGFSLIELLITVTVMVILVLVVTVSLGQLRSRSRDATRKESLQAYQVGLEQYRASSGHYLVDKQVYEGNPLSGTGIPGYQNIGYGRLTRSGISLNYPSPYSIADVLQAAGYIAKVQVDPRLQSLISHDKDSPVNGGFTGDYYLETCSYNSNTASHVADQTKQYSLYATLENTSATLSGTPCGSNGPGVGPTENNGQQSRFNFSVGQK